MRLLWRISITLYYRYYMNRDRRDKILLIPLWQSLQCLCSGQLSACSWHLSLLLLLFSFFCSSGSESKPWIAWGQAHLVTPLSWRQSPCPRNHPAWSAPPSATRPSGSSGVMVQPKLPPQTPSSISCRWGTRAAGQWPISQERGSDLTREKQIREETKASDNCIEAGGVHRK